MPLLPCALVRCVGHLSIQASIYVQSGDNVCKFESMEDNSWTVRGQSAKALPALLVSSYCRTSHLLPRMSAPRPRFRLWRCGCQEDKRCTRSNYIAQPAISGKLSMQPLVVKASMWNLFAESSNRRKNSPATRGALTIQHLQLGRRDQQCKK